MVTLSDNIIFISLKLFLGLLLCVCVCVLQRLLGDKPVVEENKVRFYRIKVLRNPTQN